MSNFFSKPYEILLQAAISISFSYPLIFEYFIQVNKKKTHQKIFIFWALALILLGVRCQKQHVFPHPGEGADASKCQAEYTLM